MGGMEPVRLMQLLEKGTAPDDNTVVRVEYNNYHGVAGIHDRLCRSARHEPNTVLQGTFPQLKKKIARLNDADKNVWRLARGGHNELKICGTCFDTENDGTVTQTWVKALAIVEKKLSSYYDRHPYQKDENDSRVLLRLESTRADNLHQWVLWLCGKTVEQIQQETRERHARGEMEPTHLAVNWPNEHQIADALAGWPHRFGQVGVYGMIPAAVAEKAREYPELCVAEGLQTETELAVFVELFENQRPAGGRAGRHSRRAHDTLELVRLACSETRS